MNEELPIKHICMTCEPDKKREEGFRLSHWYCDTHAEEARKKFKEELNRIINKQ